MRFGDTVAVRLSCSSQNEVFSTVEDGKFLVGALAIPRWLSCAAASLNEGERGDFEVDDPVLPSRFAVEGPITWKSWRLLPWSEDRTRREGQGQGPS